MLSRGLVLVGCLLRLGNSASQVGSAAMDYGKLLAMVGQLQVRLEQASKTFVPPTEDSKPAETAEKPKETSKKPPLPLPASTKATDEAEPVDSGHESDLDDEEEEVAHESDAESAASKDDLLDIQEKAKAVVAADKAKALKERPLPSPARAGDWGDWGEDWQEQDDAEHEVVCSSGSSCCGQQQHPQKGIHETRSLADVFLPWGCKGILV